MFGLRKHIHEEMIWQVLDRLYRIEEEEYQELLQNLFGITIEGGVHEFIKPPNKLGAEGQVILVRDPKDMQMPIEVSYKKNPITLYRDRDRCVLCYSTDIERFEIFFRGETKLINDWSCHIKSRPDTYASIFLYIFNRNRASAALAKQNEEDRNFIDEIFKDFRDSGAPSKALLRIAQKIGFNWAVLLVYGFTAKKLVPIIASDPMIIANTEAFPSEELGAFEIIKRENKVHSVDLSDVTANSCLCKLMYSKGAKQGSFLRFGNDPLQKGLPRGVLCLYRKYNQDIPPRDKALLNPVSREIAAWMDEVDEKAENAIIEGAIRIAESECGGAAVISVDERTLEQVLEKLGQSVSANLSKFYGSQVSGRVNFAFVSDSHTIGCLPQRLSLIEKDFTKSEGPFYIMDGKGLCAIIKQKGTFSLISCSQKEPLTVLRAHVYDWLFLLMKLVYHLIVVEKRRLVGMQRTVHLIRQPLQGFLPTLSEIRRLLNQPSFSRSDIDKYAEDMELNPDPLSRPILPLNKV